MFGAGLSRTTTCHSVVTLSGDRSVCTVLLDIEGTTTPIDFVFRVLFPYARSHSAGFLERHGSSPDVLEDLEGLLRENLEDVRKGFNPPTLSEPRDPGSFVTYIEWLIDCDRKSTPLKSLQGKIWAEGYASGQLCSQVFDDVPPALKRWQEQNRTIAIFSSGSILAQKLLFTHTTAGDLTRFLSAYFDTTIGTKTDPASYGSISRILQHSTEEILLISDVARELDAAEAAGLQALLCDRPGNHPQPENAHKVIRSFEELFPQDRQPK
jgi:enolase-phosphatase E1